MTFVPDRFGNVDSAFRLNSGYYRAPTGSYFGEKFTILAWVKMNKYVNYQRLLDFGNGQYSDNIIVSLSNPAKKILYQNMFQNTFFNLESSTILQLNIWYHVGFTTEPGTMNIYLNGTLDCTFDSSIKGNQSSRSINRTGNHFGKSSWPNDEYAQAEFDDIKIFNRALIQTEIYDEFLYGKISPS